MILRFMLHIFNSIISNKITVSKSLDLLYTDCINNYIIISNILYENYI